MKSIQRWGLLLETLSDMSDMERQLVVQKGMPGVFLPDDLILRWFDAIGDGQGIRQIGLSEDIMQLLFEFHANLRELIEIVPEDVDDPEEYIRSDEVWGAVREMADLTLDQIVYLMIPHEVEFSRN